MNKSMTVVLVSLCLMSSACSLEHRYSREHTWTPVSDNWNEKVVKEHKWVKGGAAVPAVQGFYLIPIAVDIVSWPFHAVGHLFGAVSDAMTGHVRVIDCDAADAPPECVQARELLKAQERR